MTFELLDSPDPTKAKVLTPHDRLEALLAAEMNEERAEMCKPKDKGLRAVLEMNTKLLRRLAR